MKNPDLIMNTTEYFMKKWNKEKDYVLRVQQYEAENFRSSIECTAYEFHKFYNAKVSIPVLKLTTALRGGLQMCTVTEIVGPPGSGKSQFVMTTLAINLQRSVNWSALVIDTNGNFSITRMIELLGGDKSELDRNFVSKVLKRVQLLEPLSLEEFSDIIENLRKVSVAITHLKLLVLDCPAFFLRGISDRTKRCARSVSLIAAIKRFAVESCVAVILTNQITGLDSSRDISTKSAATFDWTDKPSSALGASWSHYVNVRLYFHLTLPRKHEFRGNINEDSVSRKIIVEKSPSVQMLEIPFRISATGIQ